ncbi:MAG: 4-hydroxythreonine-4-phosphate dehydrogenase PdxA [Proteobacteria bacterium]|nr:4-hydroxythreonine-4-phosphate dehydrogenase PdxA [Pseudomonadota bacterium]
MKPVIGITLGDPAGIGPEVIVKAFSDPGISDEYTPIVIGDAAILEDTVEHLGSDMEIAPFQTFSELHYETGCIPVYNSLKLEGKDFAFGTVNKGCGDFSYKTVVKAVELALENRIDALVTAPICKESWHLAGHHHDGHTGLLAKLTGSSRYRMMFLSDKMNVILTTTHLSLRDACRRITTERVYETIRLGYEHMSRLGPSSPRIAVCGLNPHAGEAGIFGREDLEAVEPAVVRAQDDGISAEGPLSADTTFLRALNGHYDLVVAQYHDQGLIPLKLVSFDTGVNVTVGLPIIRTSVDHGTAFDIAGQGKADHRNMLCAIGYALSLSGKKA